jgi:putative transcriptional regulator
VSVVNRNNRDQIITKAVSHSSRALASRALFAGDLRTNGRILENWEQGRAKPNAQAALLINLVKRYPDKIDRLATI